MRDKACCLRTKLGVCDRNNPYNIKTNLALVVVDVSGDGSLGGGEHAACGVHLALQKRLGRRQLVGLVFVVIEIMLEEFGTSLLFLGLLHGLVALRGGVQAIGSEFGLDEFGLGDLAGGVVGAFDSLGQVLNKERRKGERK